MQNVATNYLNKKRDFPPLPSVDMEVSYSPIPTSKKAKLPYSTITKKSTVHTTSESLSKPPLPTSGSNVDRSFQLFTDGTNGSPVSQIQLSQPSRQGAVSNVRSFQSPIISTNSPPHSQNQLSSTPIAHVNSLGSTSLPLPNQPTSASAYISRAELFNILDNYVQKSEFQRLQGRYEKLKRKIAQNSTAFEDDEYYQQLTDLEMTRYMRPHCTSWRKPSLMKK